MKNYLLVHGAWHGAWAWEETKRSLEARGHHVITIDLPGHGSDTTPISGVSFRGYVDAVTGMSVDGVRAVRSGRPQSGRSRRLSGRGGDAERRRSGGGGGRLRPARE